MNSNNNYKTTVMTAATGYYHIFVLPYAASYHYFNPDSRFEFFVDDPEDFEKVYAEGLLKLRKRLGDENLVISSLKTDHLHPKHHQAVPRFFQTPTVETEFIYIGDVDVLILDSMITEQHKLNMYKNNLPFSNVIRKNSSNINQPRLTGLHFSRYEAYYPLPLDKINKEDQINLDEFALHELVRAKIGDFEIKYDFRPPHGFHFSDKLDYWNSGSTMHVGLHLHYLPNYQLLRKTDYWAEIKENFSDIFSTWLDCLDRTMQLLWSNDYDLPIIKPNFVNNKWIGPGINKDVELIQGVRLARHQFLQTKSQMESHLGRGSGAGEIFDFIDWCKDEKIISVISFTELTPIFLTSILNVFREIKMLILRPGEFDSEIFQFENKKTRSEIKKIDNIGLIRKEIVSKKSDLIIIQPTDNEGIGNLSNCINEIRIGGNESIRYFGLITADIPTEEPIKSDIGTLQNFDLQHDVIPHKTFCLNNKILKMVTGFGNDLVSKETRIYLKIYNIREINGIKPDENEIPTLKEHIDLFHQKNYNKFIQLFEAFEHRYENMLGIKIMAIRAYYLSEKYQKCIDKCESWHELKQDPIVILFKARAQRNSGSIDEAIESYLRQLELQPHNSNSLIEYSRLMMAKELFNEAKETITKYISYTGDKDTVDDLLKVINNSLEKKE